MNGRVIRLPRWTVLAMLSCLLAPPALGKGVGGGHEADTAEPARLQIRLGEAGGDLPGGTSLITPGGWFINNGFPALSADRSQIALLYYAGEAMKEGYPTFEIHSTATLGLRERVDLFPEQFLETGQDPDLRDPRLMKRIEGLLDGINDRLSLGGFHPMETLFKLPRNGLLENVEHFWKRIDYARTEEDFYLTITSLTTGQVELKMKMPGEFVPRGDNPENACGRGGSPRQAWYDPDLRILVLRVDYLSSADGCELPEEWFLRRLGDP